jgi:integrase
MSKIDLKFVHRVRKGARTYHYFRRSGFPSVALPGAPGTREFTAAYDALLKQERPPIGADHVVAGSMSAMAADWYRSAGFSRLTDTSKRTYRRLLESFLKDHGDKPVASLEPRHLLAILDRRSATPAQANALRNVLRLLLQFGFERGWRKDNPARDVKRLRYTKKPYATWTEADITAFEERWPLGSRARLALALLLYTGQRRGDVIGMGPQHVKHGSVEVVQGKTGTRLAIPLHPALRAAIAAHPGGHLAFLVTQTGEPFTATGFYNWFVECAEKAGLGKGLSPHGLRKAAARRLAEAGCTPHQIASITGHRTLAEVERYTAAANQRQLAEAAVTRLGPPRKRRS